jgi:C-terminal processing protease CtpA/Prc
MRRKHIWLASLSLLVLALALTACGTATPAVTEAPTEQATEAATAEPAATMAGPVQISGEIQVSNALIIDVYFVERFVMLEDLTGFINRDYEYEQPLEAQILGPVMVDEEGKFTYVLNLPAMPVSPSNDVDNDSSAETGIQVWQIVMNANYIDDPFLGDNETGGWQANYTSARIDAENKNEIIGGKILIWAPDNNQEFPTGFGEDGLLFTEDDPVGPVPAGYSVIDLDATPFKIIRDLNPDVYLYEGDIAVNDFSDMSWTEAFDALFNKASVEYPFTELKGIDWQALYDEFAPRIAEAEAANDAQAYYLALRDFSWSIPDGHVGLVGDDFGLFDQETAGGYGFAIIGLDDGRIIVHILVNGGPAAEAGIQLGAEILEWNGQPIADALAEVVPWSSPFSSEEVKRLQQYRYLLRAPLGTEAAVTYRNPGAAAPAAATLTAVSERESFTRTSFYYNFDAVGLPVQYEILPSGYGYVKITTLADDLNLIIRIWERAVQVFIDNEVPGIIIDLRQNSGGSPIGTAIASYFVQERIDVSRSYYYSEVTGQFETFGPPDYIEPDDELYYDGNLAVLVGPACASACEDVAYVLSLLPQTRVFGFYGTNSIFGEVARGQYELPGDYSFQIPTGYSTDMEGNIIIENVGVQPDVRVPLTEETVFAQYRDGQDVVLDFAQEVLDQPLGAGITPSGPPTIRSVSDSQDALQAGASALEDLAQESYDETSQAGQTYLYTVPLSTSRDLLWIYGWCTADQASFTDNWSKIQLVFTLDGQEVPLDSFAEFEGALQGQQCRFYYVLLSDWPVGEHVLTTQVTFTTPLNDGFADYPAGTHTYEYHVYVAR